MRKLTKEQGSARTTSQLPNQKNGNLGSLLYVRYLDHVLFRDSNADSYRPWTRETVGWLDYEDEECVRLVWERFAMAEPPNESKPRATGLVILRKAVLEERKVG
jgi:hypothetical protein